MTNINLINEYIDIKAQIEQLEQRRDELKKQIIETSENKQYTQSGYKIVIKDKSQEKIDQQACLTVLQRRRLVQRFQTKVLDTAKLKQEKALFTPEELEQIFKTTTYQELRITAI